MEENNFLKITHAVYKILDFLPDSDPLKNRAKEKVLAILENLTLVNQAKGWVSLQKEKASLQLLDDIEILENYLNVGRHQDWIDTMNFLIITKEYQRIKSTIKPPEGIIRRSLEIASRGSMVLKNKPEVIVKEIAKPSVIEKYSQRQVKILQVLNRRGKAQVSDFIKELPDITKRTVRRDLDDLLRKGEIARVGQWNQVFYQKVDRTDISSVKLS